MKCTGSSVRSLLLLGLMVGAGTASAQTLVRPKLYIWNDGVPTGVTLNAGDDIVEMVRVETYNYTEDEVLSGAECALQAVEAVLARTLPGKDLALDSSCSCRHHQLVISFSTFGRDFPDCSDANSGFYDSPINFFRQADRIPHRTGTSGNYQYTTSDSGWEFPVTNTTYSGDSYRAFRHPFIRNATDSSAPMKLWMEDFISTYVAAQVANGEDVLPDPAAVYFDTEVGITWPGSLTEVNDSTASHRGSANYVHILKELWNTKGSTDANYPDLWTGPSVPGDPDGYTLEQRYVHDIDLFGLPYTESGGVRYANLNGLTDSTLGQNNQILPVSAAAQENRATMSWFFEVTQRTIEQVMYHCAYQPLHTAWPNVKVGNYDTSKHDGQTANNMGMFYDITCGTPNHAACNETTDYANALNGTPAASNHAFTNTLPNCAIGRNVDAGLFWHLTPDSDRRWGSIVQTSKGDVDSPALYPIISEQYEYLRTRQPNPFRQKIVSTHVPWENLEETSRRVNRNIAEATQGGSRGGTNDRLLVPWLAMPGLQYADPTRGSGPQVEVTIHESSRHLADLRAKNMHEGIWFSSIPAASGATSWD